MAACNFLPTIFQLHWDSRFPDMVYTICLDSPTIFYILWQSPVCLDSLTVYCLDFLTDYYLDFLTVYCLSWFFDSLLSGLSDSLLSGFPDKVYCLDYLTESTVSMDYMKVYFLSGFSDKVDCLLGFPERGYHLDSLIVYCLFGFSGSLCLVSLTKSAVSFKYTHKRKIWMVVDDWLYKTQSQNMKDCTAVISLHQTNREITLKQIH